MITLHHHQTPTHSTVPPCDHGPCPSSSAITIQIHGSSSFSSDSTHNCNHSYFFPFAFHPTVLSALRFFGCSSTFLPNGFLSFTLFFFFLPFSCIPVLFSYHYDYGYYSARWRYHDTLHKTLLFTFRPPLSPTLHNGSNSLFFCFFGSSF
jgi:hypothetical protein